MEHFRSFAPFPKKLTIEGVKRVIIMNKLEDPIGQNGADQVRKMPL